MRLLLVDGHYYLYRSFFAIRGLSNSRGEPTNAIYGFAKALRKMIADVQPDHGAVIWDSGLPARRTTLQPAYKQNRPPMPEEMRPQEDWLQAKVPLFGLASLSQPNTEADDLIASYARVAEASQHEVVIATNDKDIMQLAGEHITIYSTAKADVGTESFARLGPAAIREKWGVDPQQIGDILALTGDSADNIPGVGGVGAKTAARLLRDFGTLDHLLASLDQVQPEKLRAKLIEAHPLILANREMVALDEDLPLPLPLSELQITPRYHELIAALRDCEFKGLLSEVEKEAAASGQAPAPAAKPKPPSLAQGELL